MPYKVIALKGLSIMWEEKIAIIAKKTYDRCQLYTDEGREEMEKYYKPSKIKKGHRRWQSIPLICTKEKQNKKLQPIIDEPYRVIAKSSNVVVKVRNLRTSGISTVHTDVL